MRKSETSKQTQNVLVQFLPVHFFELGSVDCEFYIQVILKVRDSLKFSFVLGFQPNYALMAEIIFSDMAALSTVCVRGPVNRSTLL